MAANVVVPYVSKVLMENERVKVYELVLKHGERTEMHAHPDFVIYPLTDSTMKITGEDGKSQEVMFRRGEASYRPAQKHIAENVGSTEARSVIIDLKK